MKRGKRKGIDLPVSCDLEAGEGTSIIIRGDIVSIVLTDDTLISMPEDWGLIHDTKGKCVDECEVFIAPYVMGHKLDAQRMREVNSDAISYYGNDAELNVSYVEIPVGPWDRVGDIKVINYDRYGELEGPYYHDTDVPRKRSERAILMRASRYQLLCGQRCRPFRISLPDGCRVTSHGFVWP